MNKTKKDKYLRKNKGNKRSKHKTRKEQRGGDPTGNTSGNTAMHTGRNPVAVGTGLAILNTNREISSLTGKTNDQPGQIPPQDTEALRAKRDALRAKQKADAEQDKQAEEKAAAGTGAATSAAAATGSAAAATSATGTGAAGTGAAGTGAAGSFGNFKKTTTDMRFGFGGVIGSTAPVDAADAAVAAAADVAAPVPVANPLPTPVAAPVAAPVPVAAPTEVKTADSQSDPEKTSFTDADIETMKANILENQKLQQKGNTYIDGIMKGIIGKFAFLFPDGRKKYMEGKMSNIASENTENTSNKVLQILKTYDENMNMLIEMKQKYLRVKQKLMSLDMDNIEVNKKMIEVTKKIHDVDADILENIVGTNNLVLQVQGPQIGIEKELTSVSSKGNIQTGYDNQRERSFTDKVKDKYNTFKEERSAKKVAKQQKSLDKTGTAVSPSNTAEKPLSPTAEKPPSPPVEKPLSPTAEKPLSPTAEKPPSPPVEKPSLFKRGLQIGKQLLTGKIPQQSQSTAVAAGGGNANNKTRKNRQYIHEIKENREHLFTKEMEIIKSIRNFKHGQDKKENIEKKFIKTITRS